MAYLIQARLQNFKPVSLCFDSTGTSYQGFSRIGLPILCWYQISILS